jgi:hypothetical protein
MFERLCELVNFNNRRDSGDKKYDNDKRKTRDENHLLRVHR